MLPPILELINYYMRKIFIQFNYCFIFYLPVVFKPLARQCCCALTMVTLSNVVVFNATVLPEQLTSPA